MPLSTLGQLVQPVIEALGARHDIRSQVEQWLAESYTDVGMGWDFEELEDTVDTSTIAGQDEYQYPTLQRQDTTYLTRAVKAITLRSSTRTMPLVKKNIGWIDRLPDEQGRPVIWASYRDFIKLYPSPAHPWTIRWRVWLMPTLSDPLEATTLYVPADWLQVIKWLAVQRGHMALMERDKAQEIHTLLYGGQDTNSGRVYPGIIKQLMRRRDAESPLNDWGVRVRTRSYTSTLRGY